ncbi:hypothetical protein ES705_17098 [subsurface metagenome]
MDKALFLTKQYIKLLQAIVYLENIGLPTRPAKYLLRSNVNERKVISWTIALYKLVWKNEETGIKKLHVREFNEFKQGLITLTLV